MAGRQSLYNEKDFGTAAPAKRSGGGGGGMSQKDKIKAGAAVVLLLIAGLLLAWQFGLLPSFGDSGSEPISPETQQAIEEQQRQMEQIESQIEKTQIYQGDS
ncbi:MAG: hypothetical protein DYG93_05825 [Leptolyngbya sp. PLA2]|nr:hypothetical protein [Leptolyngbya sp.]MCE7971167.1 hypothetical protein [Leptolyngbya sp. PL-A2]MCQ3940846.1 hypothetical protein [cyanobacterium CYA1]MCZ7634132.1 hypothetical protein [Phycisphaerales bacterium]GIK19290.1 MAG: hypothetical protein BroJett004_14540 [Planctomycetota bacterium]